MTGNKSLRFGVELPMTFHICFVACGPVVFYVAVDIYIGVDVVTKVAREGLIDLLVVVVALTSLGAWRAGVEGGCHSCLCILYSDAGLLHHDKSGSYELSRWNKMGRRSRTH